MDELDRRIVNALQDGVEVCDTPYARAALALGIDEPTLLDRLQALLEQGVLTRFGPMFDAARMGGAFTLCALEAPPDRFDDVAEVVNGFAEVAHNYERDHRLNMWFVLATDRASRIGEVISAIETATGLTVHEFPKLEEFRVHLRLEA